MTDSYLYAITALLPLSAVLLVVQVNPYRALILRGMLGAAATLLYTVLGAADVALTEALVGTLLAILLYAVAVRSSMVVRVGILKADAERREATPAEPGAGIPRPHPLDPLLDSLTLLFRKRHMRVELVSYPDAKALMRALADKKVHAICDPMPSAAAQGPDSPPYRLAVRIRSLYEIIHIEPASAGMNLEYTTHFDAGKAHS